MPENGNGNKPPRRNGKFVKGHSGNPGGRKKGAWSLSAAIKRQLADNPTDVEAIAQMVIKMAKKGELAAIQFLADRTEGKPIQTNRNIGEDERVQLLWPWETEPDDQPIAGEA